MLLPVKQFSREYINKDLLIFVINAESKQVFLFKIQSPTQTRTTDMQIKQKQCIQRMNVKKQPYN